MYVTPKELDKHFPSISYLFLQLGLLCSVCEGESFVAVQTSIEGNRWHQYLPTEELGHLQ